MSTRGDNELVTELTKNLSLTEISLLTSLNDHIQIVSDPSSSSTARAVSGHTLMMTLRKWRNGG